MKKAVITILGLISTPTNNNQKAKYYFTKELNKKFALKKEHYTNMLPLLVDNFSKDYKIRTIYTQRALDTQKRVLKDENISFDIENSGVYLSEDNNQKEAKYSYFLNKYNKLIEGYDEVIIDVSHGFRHLPILSIIEIIVNNIKNPDKIKYIFFAKEIEKNSIYEIIDLKEYLDLANISYMLATFNQNYTITENITFSNKKYNNLKDELDKFSDHILSNSLKPIFKENLIQKIIKSINTLEQHSDIYNFKKYLNDIKYHLQKIESLKEKPHYKRLYELSKIMENRGYLLNAITLLFESIGFYTLEAFEKNISSLKARVKEFRRFIKEKKEPVYIYSDYTMVNQARTITKIKNGFKTKDNRGLINSESLKKDIINFLDKIDSLYKLKKLIQNMEALRNNLAHGNSGKSLQDIREILHQNYQLYEYLILKQNILKA